MIFGKSAAILAALQCPCRLDGPENDMKNVLLLIHDDAGEESRFQAALDLVRALSGHLTCLDVVQLPAVMDYTMIDAEVALLADARDREALNKSRIEARLAVEDVAWDWADGTGDIAALVEAEAGLADIIVLNTAFADHEPPDMRAIVSDVVMRAGKPILAVPQQARKLDAGGHVLVAWNGSPAVAETLRAVTPLLALANGVTILEIGKTDGAPAEDAAAYLSRHGIHARIDRDVPPESKVSDALLVLCRERQPAYCVVGAYGHSRLRETLLGGVTRRMLAESPVPLLLGH
jgi:nucleotide-binding universal stress UspA family protein